MTTKEIRREIREVKREMKRHGIRRTSCFNGGLTIAEYQYNARLFELGVKLEDAKREEERTRALEHTCAGMYDLSCEACAMAEGMNQPGPEDTSGRCPDLFHEPEEWDVVGGL